MISVVIADDHALVRAGICELLVSTGEVEVCGQAGDVDSAVRLTVQCQPNALLLDLWMPAHALRPSTDVVVPQLKIGSPRTAIVVMSGQLSPADIATLRQATVAAVLQKDVEPGCLLATLRNCVGASVVADRAAPGAKLTVRERDVLRLLAKGYANKEIARALNLTHGTVKQYVSAVFAKLGVRHRAEAIVRANRSREWISD